MPRRCRPLLGTFVEISADSESALEAGFDAIARAHRLMSAHEPTSDLSRINRCAHLEPVAVDEWTARVLERALFWSKQSEGAFDVVRAGFAALERGLLPCHANQPRPRATHWTWLELEGATARLFKPACVDLGGIAKGFAVDRAVEAMRAAGATAGLVNAGGDMAGFGDQPWPVDIVHPATRRPAIEVRLRDEALATSALHATRSGGLSGDHLSGGPEEWISASVRAPACVDADALAKVVLCGSLATAACLSAVGAEALRIDRDGKVEALRPRAAAA